MWIKYFLYNKIYYIRSSWLHNQGYPGYQIRLRRTTFSVGGGGMSPVSCYIIGAKSFSAVSKKIIFITRVLLISLQ